MSSNDHTAHPLLPHLPLIDQTTPVLISGPTASGKSGLALTIAERYGGQIINADALQIYDAWPILSAQPDAADFARAPHALYGFLPHDQPYSVGDWLRDVTPLLTAGPRPIIVGGTGLYFQALKAGLAVIPPIPPQTRETGDSLALEALLDGIDDETRRTLDTLNRARVQRAWEVQHATGHSLTHWQRQPTTPVLPLEQTIALRLDADPAWLNARIVQRCETMLTQGAIDEARRMQNRWSAHHPSSKTIGAVELIGYIDGRVTKDEVIERIVIKTRQYAKRQRTWLRSKMGGWHGLGLK